MWGDGGGGGGGIFSSHSLQHSIDGEPTDISYYIISS